MMGRRLKDGMAVLRARDGRAVLGARGGRAVLGAQCEERRAVRRANRIGA